jgi:hypothetical protein
MIIDLSVLVGFKAKIVLLIYENSFCYALKYLILFL